MITLKVYTIQMIKSDLKIDIKIENKTAKQVYFS